MGQDFSDSVSAGSENGEEGIANVLFQGASGEVTVALYVAVFRFDCTSTVEVGDELGGKAAACAAENVTGFAFSMAPPSVIGDSMFGAPISQDWDLTEGLTRSVNASPRLNDQNSDLVVSILKTISSLRYLPMLHAV